MGCWWRILCAPAHNTLPLSIERRPRSTGRRLTTSWFSKGIWHCGAVDNREGNGGLLQPEEHCTKTGEKVMGVLCTKHPEASFPSAASLDTYLD